MAAEASRDPDIKICSIAGTWTESKTPKHNTSISLTQQCAWGGFLRLRTTEPRRLIGGFNGQLTEAEGHRSVIEGYIDEDKGYLNFEKIYIDSNGEPYRPPINYLFLKIGRLANKKLWAGGWSLHAHEREALKKDGYEPTGKATCGIHLISGHAEQVMTWKNIPTDFSDLKMRAVFGNWYSRL